MCLRLYIHIWRNEFVCPPYPYLEDQCLGYLRVSAVLVGSHGVCTVFRAAKPDQNQRKLSVLKGFETTRSCRPKATVHRSLLCSDSVPPRVIQEVLSRSPRLQRPRAPHGRPSLLPTACVCAEGFADTRKCSFLCARLPLSVRQITR